MVLYVPFTNLIMRPALSVLSALMVLSSSLPAQTADEIVSKYLARVGGADRVTAIQSLRRSGKFYGGGGFEAVVRYENKRPNKVREEFSFGSMTGVNAYDGKAGWKIEPWQGKK